MGIPIMIPLSISAFVAIAAAVAAIAAWRSANSAKNTSLAQITMQLTTAYAKPKMRTGMRNLREFKEKHGADFTKEFVKLESSDHSRFKQLDEDRRRFSHHLHTIFVMLDIGTVDKQFVKKLMPPGKKDPIDFLLEVIEPLEREINTDYNTTMFRTFQKIYKK